MLMLMLNHIHRHFVTIVQLKVWNGIEYFATAVSNKSTASFNYNAMLSDKIDSCGPHTCTKVKPETLFCCLWPAEEMYDLLMEINEWLSITNNTQAFANANS